MALTDGLSSTAHSETGMLERRRNIASRCWGHDIIFEDKSLRFKVCNWNISALCARWKTVPCAIVLFGSKYSHRFACSGTCFEERTITRQSANARGRRSIHLHKFKLLYTALALSHCHGQLHYHDSDLFFLHPFPGSGRSSLLCMPLCLNMINISHRMSLASKPLQAPHRARTNTPRFPDTIAHIYNAEARHSKTCTFKGYKPTSAAPLAHI